MALPNRFLENIKISKFLCFFFIKHSVGFKIVSLLIVKDVALRLTIVYHRYMFCKLHAKKLLCVQESVIQCVPHLFIV